MGDALACCRGMLARSHACRSQTCGQKSECDASCIMTVSQTVYLVSVIDMPIHRCHWIFRYFARIGFTKLSGLGCKRIPADSSINVSQTCGQEFDCDASCLVPCSRVRAQPCLCKNQCAPPRRRNKTLYRIIAQYQNCRKTQKHYLDT